MHGKLLSPEPEPVLPKEEVPLVAKTLVGARVRQSASDRTSIAFIWSLRCGKSSLLNCIVGFPLTTLGSEYCFLSGIPLLSLLQSHVSPLASTTPVPPIRTNLRDCRRAVLYRPGALASIGRYPAVLSMGS